MEDKDWINRQLQLDEQQGNSSGRWACVHQGAQEERQALWSSIASPPAELSSGERGSLRRFNSVANNLKNIKFLTSRDFQRACELPVKPKPAVRVSKLENLGLISLFFLRKPPRAVDDSVPWDRTWFSARHQLQHAPEVRQPKPPAFPGQLLQKRLPRWQGMEGPLDSR